MKAIPQSDEKKRFSLGQRSNSGVSDSFLQDSWSVDKPPHHEPQRQSSTVTIDPGDLATDSKSLQRGGSHDYQNVTFDDDDEDNDAKSPGLDSLRFSRSAVQSENSTLQSTDPFLHDSWADNSNSTIATSTSAKTAVSMANASTTQTLPLYENVWNDKECENEDEQSDNHVAPPLQIDFGELITAIDEKQQHKQQLMTNNGSSHHGSSHQQNCNDNHNNDDYHDYHKGPITVQSQPIQRNNSIVLSSSSHADPLSGDPDYENYGSEEDYANVFDTPLTPANKKSSSGYDMLELKSPPNCRSDTLSGHTFSLTGPHDEENGSHDQLNEPNVTESHGDGLVESNGDPFAGLVITASSMPDDHSCHDDLTRSMARSVLRRSNASDLGEGNRESFWSSDRVEQEFDQVSSCFSSNVTH